MKLLERKRISLSAARAMLVACERKAAELGLNVTTVVCDEGGHVVALARMDNAPLLTVRIATSKAVTAASYGIPTHVWYELTKDDPALRDGVVGSNAITTIGGGFPIHVDGQVVGAVGVAGGHYSQDMQCAEAALAALNIAESR